MLIVSCLSGGQTQNKLLAHYIFDAAQSLGSVVAHFCFCLIVTLTTVNPNQCNRLTLVQQIFTLPEMSLAVSCRHLSLNHLFMWRHLPTESHLPACWEREADIQRGNWGQTHLADPNAHRQDPLCLPHIINAKWIWDHHHACMIYSGIINGA